MMMLKGKFVHRHWPKGIMSDEEIIYCPRCERTAHVTVDLEEITEHCLFCGLIFSLGCIACFVYGVYYPKVYIQRDGSLYESHDPNYVTPELTLELGRANTICTCLYDESYCSIPSVRDECDEDCDCLKKKGQITLYIYLLHHNHLPADVVRYLKNMFIM
jgi:hypothetical protein